MSGYKKVGHKARRGRKRSPAPHGQHRNPGALRDPLTRAMKRMRLERKRRDDLRVERAAW